MKSIVLGLICAGSGCFAVAHPIIAAGSKFEAQIQVNSVKYLPVAVNQSGKIWEGLMSATGGEVSIKVVPIPGEPPGIATCIAPDPVKLRSTGNIVALNIDAGCQIEASTNVTRAYINLTVLEMLPRVTKQ